MRERQSVTEIPWLHITYEASHFQVVFDLNAAGVVIPRPLYRHGENARIPLLLRDIDTREITYMPVGTIEPIQDIDLDVMESARACGDTDESIHTSYYLTKEYEKKPLKKEV
jgi:hypothetical protein